MKPICSLCAKRSKVFYLRYDGKYIPSGFFCDNCKQIITEKKKDPVIFRMDIREFLRDAKETYDVIMADPPWQYLTEAPRESDRIGNYYEQMTTEEICNLEVQKIAGKNSYLFLWSPSPKVEEAMDVLKAWHFSYVSQFIWDKKLMGLGHLIRQQHEVLLIGRKGKPKPPAVKFKSVISEKRTDHSRKPKKSYSIIDSMFPDSKRIELFARYVFPDWHGVGYEAEAKYE